MRGNHKRRSVNEHTDPTGARVCPHLGELAKAGVTRRGKCSEDFASESKMGAVAFADNHSLSATAARPAFGHRSVSGQANGLAQERSNMKPYYQDSAVTIYHGDCREIMPELTRFDLVLTDPPYNVGLGSKPHAERQVGYVNDSDSRSDYAELIADVFEILNRISPVIIVTPGNSNQTLWPAPTWTLAWTKPNGVTRTPLTRGQSMNHSCWEPILVFGKLDLPPQSDVINIPIGLQVEAEGHPCPKPYKLFLKLITFTKAFSILDPFMGSGTTLRAAKDMNRKAVGIEIEEKYCELAVHRMEQEVLALYE